jgi:hypothetical protein
MTVLAVVCVRDTTRREGARNSSCFLDMQLRVAKLDWMRLEIPRQFLGRQLGSVRMHE